MRATRIYLIVVLAIAIFSVFTSHSSAWHDETHIAIAKRAGYYKWFNACGADMAKLKAGDKESHNHYSLTNPPSRMVTPALVVGQVKKYNQVDEGGHLYGAIIASVRDYITAKSMGKYAEYHLAFCAHYVGDLSQPLHNTVYNDFNQKYHVRMDGIINDEVLENPHKIKIYPINIVSEKDLAEEIARIANLSRALGYRIEKEERPLTKQEAYGEISHSASLFKAILQYTERMK
jgi:hypothetical protein